MALLLRLEVELLDPAVRLERGRVPRVAGGDADLVDLSRATDFVAPPGARPYRRGATRLPGAGAGSLGRPSLATAEKGKAIYERIRDRIVERIFYSAPPDA